MNIDELLVIVGGVMAVVWVNWYFRVFGRQGAGARPRDDRSAVGRGDAS